MNIMGAVIPTAACRAPKSSDFNYTLKKDTKFCNYKRSNRRKLTPSIVMTIIMMNCDKKSSVYPKLKLYSLTHNKNINGYKMPTTISRE